MVVDESTANKKINKNCMVVAPGNTYDKDLYVKDFLDFDDKTPSKISSINLGNSDFSTI